MDRDWHPGSDQKVLDLVHPSLFPLVYGRSRILSGDVIGLDDSITRSGNGTTLPEIPERQAVSSGFSRKFQWLPCNVQILDGVK